jgi:acyl-CoA synthetase (AMP-forming)/AMP-acid ligase II
MCCAPIVFNILLEAKPEERREIASPVQILVGGAPPPASLLEKMKPLGFHVTHSYGLTEVGPALVCEWQAKWNNLPSQDQSKIMARQGINSVALAHMDVKDLNTMISVPRDGKTMGEIVLKGSTVMKGYFKDPKATAKAFKNGWFATGDIGVIHPDGYLEIKDRSKDVIISGGENISSVELESVLYSHPRVLEAAVVAMPHPVWGESPCAFLAIRKNSDGKSNDLKEADIIAYCKEKLPSYMIPKKVEFIPELPKNSTGKIQKFKLRDLARNFVVSETFPSKKSAQVNHNTELQGRQAQPARVASSRL